MFRMRLINMRPRAATSHARVIGKGLLSTSAASVCHALITPLAAPAASIDPSLVNAMRSGASWWPRKTAARFKPVVVYRQIRAVLSWEQLASTLASLG